MYQPGSYGAATSIFQIYSLCTFEPVIVSRVPSMLPDNILVADQVNFELNLFNPIYIPSTSILDQSLSTSASTALTI